MPLARGVSATAALLFCFVAASNTACPTATQQASSCVSNSFGLRFCAESQIASFADATATHIDDEAEVEPASASGQKADLAEAPKESWQSENDNELKDSRLVAQTKDREEGLVALTALRHLTSNQLDSVVNSVGGRMRDFDLDSLAEDAREDEFAFARIDSMDSPSGGTPSRSHSHDGATVATTGIDQMENQVDDTAPRTAATLEHHVQRINRFLAAMRGMQAALEAMQVEHSPWSSTQDKDVQAFDKSKRDATAAWPAVEQTLQSTQLHIDPHVRTALNHYHALLRDWIRVFTRECLASGAHLERKYAYSSRLIDQWRVDTTTPIPKSMQELMHESTDRLISDWFQQILNLPVDVFLLNDSNDSDDESVHSHSKSSQIDRVQEAQTGHELTPSHHSSSSSSSARVRAPPPHVARDSAVATRHSHLEKMTPMHLIDTFLSVLNGVHKYLTLSYHVMHSIQPQTFAAFRAAFTHNDELQDSHHQFASKHKSSIEQSGQESELLSQSIRQIEFIVLPILRTMHRRIIEKATATPSESDTIIAPSMHETQEFTTHRKQERCNALIQAMEALTELAHRDIKLQRQVEPIWKYAAATMTDEEANRVAHEPLPRLAVPVKLHSIPIAYGEIDLRLVKLLDQQHQSHHRTPISIEAICNPFYRFPEHSQSRASHHSASHSTSPTAAVASSSHRSVGASTSGLTRSKSPVARSERESIDGNESRSRSHTHSPSSSRSQSRPSSASPSHSPSVSRAPSPSPGSRRLIDSAPRFGDSPTPRVVSQALRQRRMKKDKDE